MLPRGVGGESELALTAVHLGQDDLVIGVSDLHMHPYFRTGGGKAISSRVVQLHFVISSHLEKRKSIKPSLTRRWSSLKPSVIRGIPKTHRGLGSTNKSFDKSLEIEKSC